MSRDEEAVLDMLRAARLAVGYVAGLEEGEFLRNTEKQDAVVRRIEILGEAAKRVSEDFRLLHAGIPWRAAAGMRDLLIHAYERVDFEIVWRTTQEELPLLIASLEGLGLED